MAFEEFPKLEKPKAEYLERQGIALIERSSLNFQDKQDLLLVYLGEKPAAWFPVEQRYYKAESQKRKEKILHDLSKRRIELERILEKIGLPFYVKEFEYEEEKTINTGHNFLIGQNADKLNNLKKAVESGSGGEIGVALGYPETVANGFVNGEAFDLRKDLNSLSKEERNKLRKDEILKFLNFGLSKKYWREELEVVRRYRDRIREKSPAIYGQILKHGPDPFSAKGRARMTFEGILNRIEYYKRSFNK
jgi:hypothetical protein